MLKYKALKRWPLLREKEIRFNMVPATGLEPVQCYLLEPESSASANSATRAWWPVASFNTRHRINGQVKSSQFHPFANFGRFLDTGREHQMSRRPKLTRHHYSGCMENLSFAIVRQPSLALKSVSISCLTSEKISLLVRNLSPVNWCSIVPSGTSTSILIMVFIFQLLLC